MPNNENVHFLMESYLLFFMYTMDYKVPFIHFRQEIAIPCKLFLKSIRITTTALFIYLFQ